jgi:hypothetical protein
MAEDDPVSTEIKGRYTYRCTGCGHWFSQHGDAGCERINDETDERCVCPSPKEALYASYGPPFPPLTVRGRYLRHLRRYRLRNDPWFLFVRETFAALRAQREEGRVPPCWPPLMG